MRIMRRRGAWGARAAVLACAALAAVVLGGPSATGDANLVPNGSFESGLSGWAPLTSVLSLAADGTVGPQAARAALPSGSTSTSFGLIASPPVLSATTAGASYQAAGWFRSDTPGRQLCLRVRERLADGTYLYGSSCIVTSTSWQAFPLVSYTTAAAGDRLDMYVSEYGAKPGDSFEVDGLTLGQDTTPPETTLTSVPAAYSSSASASFAFASNEVGTTYMCGVDGAAAAPCVSPQAYVGLSDGVHTFTVAAVDSAGNVDPTPASFAWTVDTVGRLLANGSFEGSLVGWTGLSSTLVLAPDGAVGAQAAKASSTGGSSFGLITSPPALSSTTAGRPLNAGARVRSDTPGRQLCLRVRERLADGTYLYGAGCVTSTATWQTIPPVAYTPAADGDRLDVYVSEYGAVTGDSFEVDGIWLAPDTTPPDTTIATAPAAYTSDTSAGFAFTASEPGSSFLCGLDGAALTPCTSPQAYSALADGAHAFRVAAVDPAGNADPTPATARWTIDTYGGILGNGSFEGSTTGWTGLTGTVAVAGDGVVGTGAARAAPAAGTTSFGLIASPPAIASVNAGRIYDADAWVRSDRPGLQVCLKVRERQADGSYLYGSSCVAAQAGWQQLPPIRYTTAADGDRLDVYVTAYGAQATDTFEADGLYLRRVVAPPASTSAPTLSGTARDGETLTATVGTWSGTRPIAVATTWRLCDASGAACADTGATGSSFVLDSNAVGHTVEAVVTATNMDGAASLVAGPSSVVQAVAPGPTAPPSVTGTAQIRSTLTGSAGTWTGTQPIALALQWRRCAADGSACADITGATGTTYTTTIDDIGHALVLAVVATNTVGAAAATSAATSAVVDTPQPTFPVRAAFYYPWFPAAWKQNGLYPYTHYHPTLGLYDSSNVAGVVKPHVTAMLYGHIQAGIASWWGIGDDTDQNFAGLLQAAAGTSFRWAIYYEAEGQGNPAADQIRADLLYIKAHYASDPSYLRINGRFVVFVWDNGPNDIADGCALADRWKAANTVGAYLVLKVFNGYRLCASQPDSWHQYGPASAESSQSPYSFSISPGFWRGSSATPNLTRDPTRWSLNIRDMVASKAPWQLITTFNEWGEGSAVESADEWASPSGYGAYLDALSTDGIVNGTLPPANTAVPTITAAPNTQPGATLTASAGTWSNVPTSYAYQWRRCDSTGSACADIAGATAAAYVPTSDDLGSTLRVVVTAANAGGSASATALQASIVVASALPDTHAACTGAAPPAAWSHVIWIWMENKTLAQVVGAPNAPLTTQLAAACGVATGYTGVAHPSLPNYIAATSGDTQGITDDGVPALHPLAVPSIFSQVTAAGLTWREYEEAAPSTCAQTSSGNFSVRHDPAAYYTSLRAECTLFDVPAGNLHSGALLSDLAAGTLPSFAFITPDICNDMHVCDVQAGDDWLRAWLPLILASTAYAAGTTAVFVVWDENDGSSGNLVPMLVVSPSTAPGTSVSTALNHYALLHTTEEMLGLGFLGNAATATSMRTVFGLG